MITNDNAGWTLGLLMFVVFALIVYLEPGAKWVIGIITLGGGLFFIGAAELALLVMFIGIPYALYKAFAPYLNDENR